MDEPSAPSIERPLGGQVTGAVRVGETVRRATGPWTPAVHALLRHLEALGFAGAPRVLGLDARGREVLSFIPGDVPQAARAVTDAALGDLGRLLRRYHDAVAGFAPPSELSWHWQGDTAPPGPRQLVCHNDLAPHNTVFRGGRPVAFLDWDFAGPGPAVWDVANAAWQFVPLADDADFVRVGGWTEPPDRCRRLRIFADAYDLPRSERAIFAEAVMQRMEVVAAGIERLAAAGGLALQRLLADGVPAQIRLERAWVQRHAAQLNTVLS